MDWRIADIAKRKGTSEIRDQETESDQRTAISDQGTRKEKLTHRRRGHRGYAEKNRHSESIR
jgi:hypothetical protein